MLMRRRAHAPSPLPPSDCLWLLLTPPPSLRLHMLSHRSNPASHALAARHSFGSRTISLVHQPRLRTVPRSVEDCQESL